MRFLFRAIVATVAMAALPLMAEAGPERVAFPVGYSADFILYAKIDQAKKKRIRFMYSNRKVGPDGAMPDGSVVIMEDHEAALAEDGTPKTTADGRLIATEKIRNIFVMEKRAGWGDAYPEATRNGDWEYAWFQADGAVKPGKTMEKCFACHKKQAAQDYMFTNEMLAKAQ
jgi:hypothetical protein